MNEELISVVIPVYNVEKYIDKCVDSIINQTYKNLEIILVDDGSTDRSGQKCDEWAKIDSRIKVLHKQNGGLSDARNYGIKEANGVYIGFVDSDDYVDLEMYDILLSNLKKFDADISVCSRVIVPENSNQQGIKLNEPLCFSSRDMIKDLFVSNKYTLHAAWDKLYKRELFLNIEFPVGRLFEDAAIMYKVFESASKIVTTKAQLYYYVQRYGSISNCDYNSKKVMHQFENRMNAIEYYKSNDNELMNCAIVWNLRFVISLWYEAYENDVNLANKMHRYTKKNFNFKIIKYLSLKSFVKSLVFIINPKVLYFLRQNKTLNQK